MTPDLHPLLQRQLRRLGIDADGSGPSPAQWPQLVQRLSRAYADADQDRYLLELLSRPVSMEALTDRETGSSHHTHTTDGETRRREAFPCGNDASSTPRGGDRADHRVVQFAPSPSETRETKRRRSYSSPYSSSSSEVVLHALPRSDAFVAAVGAFTPQMAELSPDLCRHMAEHGTVVVDTVDAGHEAGDLLQAGLEVARFASLADVVGSESFAVKGPVLFKSCGWAGWDLAAARTALRA